MKLAAFSLLFTLALSAQVTTEDAIVNRLESALQSIDAEKGDQEISIVVAVQANRKIQPEFLRNFRRVGSMLEPLVSSGRGEVEVLSYGDTVRLLVAEPRASNRRKIVIVIGETSKDPESEQKLKDAIEGAAKRLPNVVFLFPLIP